MRTKAERLGIATGAIGAALFFGGAVVVDRSMFAARPVAAVAADPTASAVSSLAAETVYVLPEPSAAVIHVTRTAAPVPAPTVRVVVPVSGDDEHESEHQGGGDD